MRNLDQNDLTFHAVEAVSGAGDLRVQEVSKAMIEHLHAFVREVRPTQAEWNYAIDFLTRTGQACSDVRQEFILLSDILGVSMLVDLLNHQNDDSATETTVFGPFFVASRREFPLGSDISGGVAGTPMYVAGTVRSPDGRAIAGALVDCWHSDGDGFYDVQRRDELALRGAFRTDESGRFRFWSIRPTHYAIPTDGPVGELLATQKRHPYRPEHVHFMISAEGFQTLVTHVFIEGDPYLDSDVVFGVKSSLVTRYEEHAAGVTPDGTIRDRPYVQLGYDFALAVAE